MMDAERVLNDARRRTAAAKLRRSETRLGGNSERSEVARIEKDTRAIRGFTSIFRRQQRKLRLSPGATSVIELPSGKRYVLNHSTGKIAEAT
jgi:hypothetical protein